MNDKALINYRQNGRQKMMISSPLAKQLYDEISQLTIIDAHEHLPPEKEYLSYNFSGPNMFAGYIWHDLESAGMSSEFKNTLRDGGDRPVEEWWPIIKPFWEHVKYNSYAKSLRITARDIFGIESIDDSTINLFAEKVKADNQPGLYNKILTDRCRISAVVTCAGQAAFPDDDIFHGITYFIKPLEPGNNLLTTLSNQTGTKITTLEDAGHAVQELLKKDLQDGAIGFKMTISNFQKPDMIVAEKEFSKALNSPDKLSAFPALRDYLVDKCLDVAAEANVPVAVHTGYWGDFRDLDPKYILPLASRRRDVQFDLFHLGVPMVRDAALIGKNLPNVTLNLTWCSIISQQLTYRMLTELIDMVPANKIIAFGGDYRSCVQKVYGHLVMARQVVASALADRIEAGDFDREYALYLAKLWFHDNPKRIYNL